MPRPVVVAATADSLSDPMMLLVCSRAYPQELRSQFELPDDKIKEDEDSTAALIYEVTEELDVRLTTGERVYLENGWWWPILGGRITGVWFTEVATGSPAPRASASYLEARWVSLTDLATLPWIAADLPIVEAVVVHCARQQCDVALGVWNPTTDARVRREQCRCVNVQFALHALPFGDTQEQDVRISVYRRLLASPSPFTAS